MSVKSEDRARKEYLHGKSIGDGVLRKEFKYSPHEDQFYVTLKSDVADDILRYNKRLRRAGVHERGLEWGRMVAQIPFDHLQALMKLYPELRDPRHPDRQKTLMKILNSPEGLQYRVVEKI